MRPTNTPKTPNKLQNLRAEQAALTRVSVSVHQSRHCHRGSKVEGHQTSSGRVGATDQRFGTRARRPAAIPTKKRGPATWRPPHNSKEAYEVFMTRAAKHHAGRLVEEDVTPEDVQGLTEWLTDRRCDLRGAIELGICHRWAI